MRWVKGFSPPLPGSVIQTWVSGWAHDVVFVLNYACWGAGFILYMGLYAICMYRYITHSLPQSRAASTVWINLGPIGAGVSSLYMLVARTDLIVCRSPLYLAGFMLWGFGLW